MRLTVFILISYQLLQCQSIKLHILIFKLLISFKLGADCFQEQPLCLTVNLTTLLNVCKNFFKVPCPKTCGVCACKTKPNFN